MPTGPSVLIPSSWRPEGQLAAQQLPAALADLRASLEAQNLTPVHVRIYATPTAGDAAAAGVRDLFAPATPAVSVVTTTPCAGGEIAGVHVLSTASKQVVPIVDGGHTVGVRIDVSPPMVVLAGLTSPTDDDAASEFAALFDRAERLLGAHGLSFTDVARTWLHLPHLLRDYDDLNVARSAFFALRGIGRATAPPASTGIQGGALDSSRMQMDLVATSPDAFHPLVANLQCEAWEYGSAFSRGMTLRDIVTVSGTASIDADGHTIHLDDAADQIRATWSTVRELLASEQVSLPPKGPQAWVLYFKNPTVWQAWRSLVAAGEVEEPAEAVCVYADVCRDNLLFEMELTAAR
ncbi:MAG: hypothetical protein KDA24_30020 [Deltaproteobacteria bacterium]|nr:hypothetical protein [Deltaproteobacteria bacterium]